MCDRCEESYFRRHKTESSYIPLILVGPEIINETSSCDRWHLSGVIVVTQNVDSN